LERNFRVMDVIIKFQSVRLDESVSPPSEAPIPEEPMGEELETDLPAPSSAGTGVSRQE
jgi:hypothetical protein